MLFGKLPITNLMYNYNKHFCIGGMQKYKLLIDVKMICCLYRKQTWIQANDQTRNNRKNCP